MSSSTTTASTVRPSADPNHIRTHPKPGPAPGFRISRRLTWPTISPISGLLDVGTPENAARALDLYANTPEDEDGLRLWDGFDLSIQTEGRSEL